MGTKDGDKLASHHLLAATRFNRHRAHLPAI